MIVPVKMIFFFRFVKVELIKLASKMAGIMHEQITVTLPGAPGDYID